MISLQDITLRFGERTLFDKLSWHIDSGSRAGLVGDNGSGKTTLFRIVLGETAPEGGTVVRPKAMTLGHLPQQQATMVDSTVAEYLRERCGMDAVEREIAALEHLLSESSADASEHTEILQRYERALSRFHSLDGHEFGARAERILHGLGFKPGASTVCCRAFSGGWQMRICLAALLLADPDAMLLDEPTNHLDTDSMEWLEEYLKGYRGTVITVAHDRAFLDRITSSTAVLERGQVTVYSGNYTAHLELRAEQEDLLERQARKAGRERAHMEAFVERFKAKATKASQARSRMKMLDKLDAPDRPQRSARAVRIRFTPRRRSGADVFSADKLAKRYGELQVFAGLELRIGRGEKVGLIGVNGAGKSTLLRLLTKTEPPTAGEVVHGADLDIGYFSQVAGDTVAAGSGTVWDEACAVRGGLTPQQVRNLLGAFLFSGDDIQKPVSVLSGGERSRLALLRLLMQGPNVLVLDEPTNHLDMRTKDVFMEALQAYPGTLLLVSHDRYLLDHVILRIVELRDGRLHDYPGNYSYFVQKRALDQAAAAEAVRAPVQDSISPPAPRGSAYEERKRRRRSVEQLRRRRDEAEGLVGTLEQRKQEIETMLCDPDVFADQPRAASLGDELSLVTLGLDKAYNDWNDLCSRAAALEQEAPDEQ